MPPLHVAQLLPNDLAHLRITMNRENHRDVRKFLRQPAERLIDMTHRLAKIFPAVRRYQHDTMIFEIDAR